MKPEVIDGGLAVDDRGSVLFVNDLSLKSFRRFYLISNHMAGFVRAWHGHKLESKVLVVVRGTMLIGAVQVDDWISPSRKAEVMRVVLSASKPSALSIPPGFANGSMSLTQDAQLLVFSNSSVEESQNDDYRFPADYWDIWTVEQR